MIKSSALYIVIIIALVIGLLCSALIVSAYFYKAEYQKKIRYDRLENNLNSGINILLAGPIIPYSTQKRLNLYDNNIDSVTLERFFWGMYDVGVVKSFNQKDTLFKIFSIGNDVDSAKWAALYLIDEDRPFSLSGKTTIRGAAYIPKAGVQQAYIDNHAYQGDKRLIIGPRYLSEKKLPALDTGRIALLRRCFNSERKGVNTLPDGGDSLSQSFLNPTLVINFKKKVQVISKTYFSGNIMIFSDTAITIDNSAILKNIMIFAPSIIIKSGFTGNCQLFASDSIKVENGCTFTYPSCLAVLRLQPSIVAQQAKLIIGENTNFQGIILDYQQIENRLQPIISIGKKVKISGQVYSQGLLELKDDCEIDGSVFTSRFIYRNSFTIFENYLINTTIDERALSRYYLTSSAMPVAAKRKKILRWLEAN